MPIKGFSAKKYSDLLKKIAPQMDSDDYYLPAKPPKLLEQVGHCCGMYALHGALTYAYPDQDVPLPRAEAGESSLYTIAQKARVSDFGPIYSVKGLKRIAKDAGFSKCDILPLPEDQESYIRNICNSLKKGGSIVAACEVNIYGYPANRNGLGTHWVDIFGYFYAEDHCYFVLTQGDDGDYFVVSAEKFYESNLNLPKLNPKAYPHYVYYKDSNDEHFVRAEKAASVDATKSYAIGQTLTNFAFGALFVPKEKALAEETKMVTLRL